MRLLGAARQPFVGLAFAAIMGIILAEWLPLSAFALTAIAIFSAACVIVPLFSPRVVATYLVVWSSFFLLHNFQTSNTDGQQIAAQLGNRPRTLTATGYVISEPKVAPNGFATFLLKLESIELEGRKESTPAVWQVRWRGTPEFGDELKLSGTAEPIEPPRNPGEFDMRSYLARRDVRRLLFVRYPEDGALIRHGGGNWILWLAQKSRAWMQNALCRDLENTPEVQSFLSGIVLGLRHQTPEDIEEPFQQTGTLHLFAVAGLHVGIVAALLWMLATTVARLSRKWATAIIIPLLFFYAAVTGLHVSSVRAAVMASILLGGFFFERKAFLANSLAAAAFFLLCWNTNELFSTGFQLSFAVVGTIVVLADPIAGFLQRWAAADPFLPRTLLRGPRHLMHATFEWLCRGASVSLAAWIGSLPFILWYFHLVTPISLFANLLVVPIAFFILAIALLSLLSAALPWLAITFNNANWFLAKGVLAIVQLFAQIPGGHFYVQQPHWPEKLTAGITVLDLGAGAAVHVRTGNADWLFDCGSERSYQQVVREYLHWAGVNRLDGLLLTHGDALHIGGTVKLLRDFPRIHLIDNPAPDHSTVHQGLQRLLRESGIKRDNFAAGDHFPLSKEVKVRVLFPPHMFSASIADDQAYVVRLSIAPSSSILLMSDSGKKTEDALLAADLAFQTDILVKGQHHFGESGTGPFLDAVRPRLVIATSRDFPEYERINDKWANELQERGIKLFRQDETGAVTLRFRHNGWEAQSYITGETFRSSSQ
jgi:competence protein ComEC